MTVTSTDLLCVPYFDGCGVIGEGGGVTLLCKNVIIIPNPGHWLFETIRTILISFNCAATFSTVLETVVWQSSLHVIKNCHTHVSLFQLVC